MPQIITAGIPRTQFSKIHLLAALKLDPDLDGNPPTQPSAPPPCNAASLNERNQTDALTVSQEKTNAEAVRPDTSAPPQSSATNQSSPTAHRLCHHTQDAVLSMPMVEVAGPEGATLVFRAWTSADVTAASQHLPNPTASDWQKIANKFPSSDLRCKHVNWEDESNVQYRDAVHSLCEAFTKAFPVKSNLEKITACRQKDNEDPDEYLTRLTEIFNSHSGLQPPAELGNTLGAWENHLCNCFLNGLKPDISSAVKSTCIGWSDARLSEL
ncbi:uncharacterized protein LOC115426259 [Sphaeramia orbicularis]|uniref:uncharacterized protein LOC115426259 n=1 Tax=Sphaeramia orbicularis TaxID=375764 RepID=UPI00117D2070|nr:uncharacterized protein LOC115426259 [Sphaeramia orbicularis]